MDRHQEALEVMERKQTTSRLAGGVFAGRRAMNLSVEGMIDIPQEITEPDPIAEPPDVGPPSEYTIIKVKEGLEDRKYLQAPYEGQYRYSFNDDADGNPEWSLGTSGFYCSVPMREGNLAYFQSTQEAADKGFKYGSNGHDDWIEDIICIEKDEVVNLQFFGYGWGSDPVTHEPLPEKKYMTCLERPITIVGQDPEKIISMDWMFQWGNLDQSLETFLFNYIGYETYKPPYMFGGVEYNYDISKWMGGVTYGCVAFMAENYKFDLSGIKNRCNNTSNHQDFKTLDYDLRPRIIQYSKGPGHPPVPYEPIGLFHKYQGSSSTMEEGESYIYSYIKLGLTDEEGTDTSDAIQVGDSVSVLTDYGDQLFFYKCSTIKDLTKGKQYNFERVLSDKSSPSSSSTQYKLYLYKGADVDSYYTTSKESHTAKWIDAEQFEFQVTLKNQSAENITVESNNGVVEKSELAPLETTKVTRVVENPTAGETVSINAKSTNPNNVMEKDFEAKVVKYSTPTENSYVHYNNNKYSSGPGGGKMYIASSYVTYYGNRTDANGKKTTDAEKPEVDDIAIVNGAELRVGTVSWYSSYYYMKLYPNDNTPADYKENFSTDYSGERIWIEFL
jgi:hypothetical protein